MSRSINFCRPFFVGDNPGRSHAHFIPRNGAGEKGKKSEQRPAEERNPARQLLSWRASIRWLVSRNSPRGLIDGQRSFLSTGTNGEPLCVIRGQHRSLPHGKILALSADLRELQNQVSIEPAVLSFAEENLQCFLGRKGSPVGTGSSQCIVDVRDL